MFRKKLAALILGVSIAISPLAVQASGTNIDRSQVENGIVKVNFESDKGSAAAVRVQKGNEKKDHILGGNNSFPLQFGKGEYTITLLESAGNNKFRQVEKQVVEFKAENEKAMYLRSVQSLNWNENMKAVKIAKELTKNAKTDREKVEIIHDYIIKNIKYDDHKALNVKPGYLASIDLTLEEGKGICYDYSALFAGMTRSLDIPTKLVEGKKNDIKELHAWNQVYIAETNEWIIVDTTYDAAYVKANAPVEMIKNANEYKVQRAY